jgi:hypothetical protein
LLNKEYYKNRRKKRIQTVLVWAGLIATCGAAAYAGYKYKENNTYFHGSALSFDTAKDKLEFEEFMNQLDA